MKPLQLGVIGCGEIAAGVHLPNLMAIAECRLAALAEPDAGRLGKVGDKFGVPPENQYLDTADLLARPDIDAVLILTPAETHLEVALQASRAGKHIFVEKPMALTVADCEHMQQAADNAGVRLAVGHYYRFLPTHQRVRQMVQRGDIGQVTGAQVHLESMALKPQEGQIQDFAPHFIELLLWYFADSQVREVYAVGSNIAGGGESAETEISLVMRFTSGLNAVINQFWIPEWRNWDAGERYIRIIGTHGKIKCGLNNAVISVYRSKSLLGRVRGSYDIIPRFVYHPLLPITGTSFRKELEDFINAVRDSRLPAVSGETGLEVVRIIEAATASMKSGRPVEVCR